MAHRLAPQVESELDEIWYYVAQESGSVDTADRLINLVTERFLLLAQHLMQDAAVSMIFA